MTHRISGSRLYLDHSGDDKSTSRTIFKSIDWSIMCLFTYFTFDRTSVWPANGVSVNVVIAITTGPPDILNSLIACQITFHIIRSWSYKCGVGFVPISSTSLKVTQSYRWSRYNSHDYRSLTLLLHFPTVFNANVYL